MIRTTPSPFDFSIQREERQRQRTRTFLLYEAFRETSSNGRLVLAYRVGDAFFYQIEGRHNLLPAEVEKLKEVMQKKVSENRTLEPLHLSRQEALDEFKQAGKEQTHNWVNDMSGSLPVFYRSVDGILAFKGALTDSTLDVGIWDLQPYPPGLLMRAAPPQQPELQPYHETPTLFRTFFEAKQWGMIHGASYISDVNRVIRSNEMLEFVQVAEALQARKIALIADQITLTQPRPRVILVSGPSASGKTSFSKLLLVQLRVLGLKPLSLSLDNYYLPRDQAPRNADGKPDYEALEAINIDLFNDNLLRLVAGEEVCLPLLDFKTRNCNNSPPLCLAPEGILIIEGIHGLNPGLTPHLTAPSIFKVFVSALNHLNLDEMSRVSTTDLRLLRRIVRDRRARGYSAEDTLSRWSSVREGEHRHIFTYQEEADIMFNSALPYELHALKLPAEEALSEINDSSIKPEAERLKNMLDAVTPLPVEWTSENVPRTSIFREFFGNSALVG